MLKRKYIEIDGVSHDPPLKLSQALNSSNCSRLFTFQPELRTGF